MNADALVELLAAKHSKDIFIPACKTGPSSSADLQQLDALSIRRSWKHPCISGYEVKVSRSDFLRDKKWPGYLPCCNEFYFVAPPDLIAVEELPPEVGLIAATKNGKRLLTKRKAAHREIDPPVGVLLYILFWRARIDREGEIAPSRKRSLEYWKDWLEEKRESHRIGHLVSLRMGRELRERELAVSRREREVESRRTEIRKAEAALFRITGCDDHASLRQWTISANEAGDVKAIKALSDAAHAVQVAMRAVEKRRTLESEIRERSFAFAGRGTGEE